MLHFIHGLLLGVFIPVTIMIVLRNLPMKWWIVGLAAYSFRLSFTGNAGVSLVGFYVQHLGWQWLYWQDAVIALLMVVLTLLGTPRESHQSPASCQGRLGRHAASGCRLALIYAGLDQGNRLDWFQSGTVTALLAGGAALVVCFLINEALVAEPWASPTVLMSRNVLLAMSAMITYMVTSLSNTMLVPTFLTTVARLRPEQTGSLLLLYTALPICHRRAVAIYLLAPDRRSVCHDLRPDEFCDCGLDGNPHHWGVGAGRLHPDRVDAVPRPGSDLHCPPDLRAVEFQPGTGHRLRRLYPGDATGHDRDSPRPE